MQRGVLLTTADQLMQRLPPRGWLAGRAFNIRVGGKLDPQRFREPLIAAGYQSVPAVHAPVDFSGRGALHDLFTLGATPASRSDLFADVLETRRNFDPATQHRDATVVDLRTLPD